ncbi:hypothetical protein ACS5PN_06330 [Roseateles sp. NT4]|uniref:hypothetical protein n=1 Tax=Roseateles sp. NT4 TaxID=3453715 RepID=UPI003EEE3835
MRRSGRLPLERSKQLERVNQRFARGTVDCMKCALCLLDRPIRRSHIVPEFLYLGLYDEKHRFEQISADPLEANKTLQKGLREPLLCDDCEGLFAKWERYVSMVLRGGAPISIRQEGDRLHLSSLEYQPFKLLQMSILWRAGVSTLPAFSQVQLGPHAERLRKMLLSSDPGPPDQYGCLIFMVMNEQTLVEGLVVPPTWARLHQHKAYRFVFGGLAFLYLVTSQPVQRFIAEHFLQTSGSAVVRLQQIQEMKYLIKTINEISNLGKLDSSDA